MNQLFEESRIAGVTINNRIFRSATYDGLADERGCPTDQLIRKYRALAKGGCGAIITGYTGVLKQGEAPMGKMLMIDNDQNIGIFSKLADAVHKENTPIFLQIAHCGRQTSSRTTGMPIVAPSPVREKMGRETPKELTEDQIEEIIQAFIAAARRAQ